MAANKGLISKAIVSTFGVALTTIITALQDGKIEAYEWVAIVVATLGARGLVWLVENAPFGWRAYLKMIVALAIGLGGGLSAALLDGQGITMSEGLTLLLNLATAYVVYQTPNASDSVGVLRGDPVDLDPAHADLGNEDF